MTYSTVNPDDNVFIFFLHKIQDKYFHINSAEIMPKFVPDYLHIMLQSTDLMHFSKINQFSQF